MRKLIGAVFLMFLMAGLAAAQDFPKVEIFGGYSLLKVGGDDINELYDYWESDPPEVFTISTSKWFKKGFNASAAFNVNEYFGIEGNFQYNTGNMLELTFSGNTEGGEVNAAAQQKLTDFSFMAGPRFTIRKNESVTPFAHVLFGMDRVKLTASGTCDADGEDCFDELAEEAQLMDYSDTGFGFMVGGGLDVNVSKSFAIRLIQADYVRASHEDATLNYLNLAFGVVLRLGN